jgi:hypothetical protein
MPTDKPPGRKAKTGREIAESFVEAGKPYRWKPGVSGNPSGRPAVQKLSAAIRQVLGEPVPGGGGITYAQAIARKLADRAAAGCVRSAELLGDRAEGRPTQSLDIELTALAQRFESMTREELLTYAETGSLPEEVTNDEENQSRE